MAPCFQVFLAPDLQAGNLQSILLQLKVSRLCVHCSHVSGNSMVTGCYINKSWRNIVCLMK